MNPELRKRLIQASAGGALALSSVLVQWHEGVRHAPYHDGGGVLTCYGHTGPDVVSTRRYTEFDRAFIESLNCLREEMNNTARKNLKLRKRKIVKQTAEGESVITEDILPTHNDLAVLTKLGVSASVVEEKNEERSLLRNTMKRKIAGELTALEAAQLLESEGIAVPKTLMLEVQKEIGASGEELSNMAFALTNALSSARDRVKNDE